MNYFDIFRIDYEDLKIIAEQPERIITSVNKEASGYRGEIILLGEHPDRRSNVLFFHEQTFESAQKAREDLDQIIEAITKASESTRNSEAIKKGNTPE
jgi:hypothetical protein